MGLNKISALEVINNLSEKDLKSIIKIFGEEKEASKIAKNIIKQRDIKKNYKYLINLLRLLKK